VVRTIHIGSLLVRPVYWPCGQVRRRASWITYIVDVSRRSWCRSWLLPSWVDASI
jgi:hypothetical protein